MNEIARIEDAVPLAPRHPDAQTVTAVKHFTDRLFSFRVTRPKSLRFRSGEFAMIGLQQENGKPLLRAYSIASPSWDDELEFYSIKVPDGPLTSRLQEIAPGDAVIVRPKPTGTLVLDALLPGKRIWLIASGTGIAPFASLIRDPELYERFDEVILTHTCRTVPELDYGAALVANLADDPLVGAEAWQKLHYYPTTTRQESRHTGRITDLLKSGKVFSDLEIPPLGQDDRVMICGSMALNLEVKAICEAAGLGEGSNAAPGEYVLEKAFVG
ncbi:ferredoxin--NADP reductase [Salaquimonas pukyongi]|uniref:ferredoxin--NADP reductase n=1 Tax=Salaquimonas pukyongi TaxID=2712698 RepID=UPI00096BB0DE|nr:ferredoxin--NADP reductase [Salaquimonas pukyongi]